MSITERYNNEIYHYGVKGMKWGVRKSEYKSMSKRQKKQVRDEYRADKKWLKNIVNQKTYYTAWRNEVNALNTNGSALNKKLGTYADRKQREEAYRSEINNLLQKTMTELVGSVTSPSKRYSIDMFIDETMSMPYMALLDKTKNTVELKAWL